MLKWIAVKRTPPLNVALLGCGRIARRFHLPILASMPDVRVRAIADPDRQAHRVAPAHSTGIVWLDRWEDALTLPAIDVAVICLPSDLHAPAALAAIKADVPFYLEKPLATTATDAKAVATAADAAGTTAQIGFNFRFHPGLLQLRRQTHSHDLGEVLAVTGITSNPVPAGAVGRTTSGPAPVILDLAVHHIDLVRLLLRDEFANIDGVLCPSTNGAATAHVRAQMRHGAVVNLLASHESAPLDSLTILGSNGSSTYDRFNYGGTIRAPAGPSSWRRRRTQSAARLAHAALRQAHTATRRQPDPSYQRALQHFVKVVRGEARPGPTIADGLRAAEVCDAIARSLASGMPVDL